MVIDIYSECAYRASHILNHLRPRGTSPSHRLADLKRFEIYS
jgi:hypothetical protein